MVHFREVQRFAQWWFLFLLVVPVGMTFYLWKAQSQLSHAAKGPLTIYPILIVVSTPLLLIFFWFSQAKLITEVRSDALSIRFFLLWPERVIPWNDIRSAESVVYRPIRDYGGWGVRFGPAGRAYNVRGSRGVRIELANGEKILIGSQQPDDLARAIGERTGPGAKP